MLSENMVTYRYQWFFIVISILSVKNVRSPAVSKCGKIETSSVKPMWQAHVILCKSWNFHREKSDMFSRYFEIEGFCGHPIWKFLEVFTIRFFGLSINWRICTAKQWSCQDNAEKDHAYWVFGPSFDFVFQNDPALAQSFIGGERSYRIFTRECLEEIRQRRAEQQVLPTAEEDGMFLVMG